MEQWVDRIIVLVHKQQKYIKNISLFVSVTDIDLVVWLHLSGYTNLEKK